MTTDAKKLEELVNLYEDGYEEIQAILTDADLAAEEQLEQIADVVFANEGEND